MVEIIQGLDESIFALAGIAACVIIGMLYSIFRFDPYLFQANMRKIVNFRNREMGQL